MSETNGSGELQAFVSSEYDRFEKQGLTVRQTLDDVERRIIENRSKVWALEIEGKKLRYLRNDMPSNLGKITDRFDRQQHTHGGEELSSMVKRIVVDDIAMNGPISQALKTR